MPLNTRGIGAAQNTW